MNARHEDIGRIQAPEYQILHFQSHFMLYPLRYLQKRMHACFVNFVNTRLLTRPKDFEPVSNSVAAAASDVVASSEAVAAAETTGS